MERVGYATRQSVPLGFFKNEKIRKEKMGKNNYDWLVGFCIAIAALLGFVLGFSHGIGKGVEECDKWKEMYDKHITDQWKMIQRKDSMYAEYFRLRIEYLDGTVLEPKTKPNGKR